MHVMATERQENANSPCELGDTSPLPPEQDRAIGPPSRTGDLVNPKADENITTTTPSSLFVRSTGVTRGADVGLEDLHLTLRALMEILAPSPGQPNGLEGPGTGRVRKAPVRIVAHRQLA